MPDVIKRDGTKELFNKEKIENAILKAMKNGSGIVKPVIARNIADEIEEGCSDLKSVEIPAIELMIYEKLIAKKQKLTARAYEGYRSVREFQRKIVNSTDKEIVELIDGNNEYWKGENANKNPILNTTIRDYMAGITSTDAVRRYLLSPEIVQAHDEGILHFHDADYFIQHMHNCDLINLEDMLQNGTVISETLIESPHSFSTACTVSVLVVEMTIIQRWILHLESADILELQKMVETKVDMVTSTTEYIILMILSMWRISNELCTNKIYGYLKWRGNWRFPLRTGMQILLLQLF